ncbi:hypothetical protein P879_09571 [Paragonimus westermani]|uniref:Uncharacterized protein n=1 Tax=Paragonimus westermani TaxID=34504 RepID=A0A8T0D9B1_9TREM|nr:hypothetical protein P879_09571 [Paragonimus westermani]
MKATEISTTNIDYLFLFVLIFGSFLCLILLSLFIYLFVRNIIRICRKNKTIKNYNIIEDFHEYAISKTPSIENPLSTEYHRHG